MYLSVQQRVYNGTKFLDQRYPNWEYKIDTSKLDISNFRYCIVGQLKGDFKDFHGENWRLSGYDKQKYDVVSLGFDADHTTEDCFAAFDSLTAEWVKVINERRATQ